MLIGKNTFIPCSSCEYFTVRYLELDGAAVLPGAVRFHTVTVLEGEGSFNGTPVKKGQSFLVPHGTKELAVEGRFTAILSEPV